MLDSLGSKECSSKNATTSTALCTYYCTWYNLLIEGPFDVEITTTVLQDRSYFIQKLCLYVCVVHIINRSGLNTIPGNIRTRLPIRSVVCLTRNDQGDIYKAPTRA